MRHQDGYLQNVTILIFVRTEIPKKKLINTIGTRVLSREDNYYR